jgi:hypothetical protein
LLTIGAEVGDNEVRTGADVGAALGVDAGAAVGAVTVTSSAIPIGVEPPLAHSITEIFVSVESPQTSVLVTFIPTPVHTDMSFAADGPVPLPAAAHMAVLGEVPAFAV